MTVVATVTQRGLTLSRAFASPHASTIKRSHPQGTGMYARHILPTDALGLVALTLTNLVVGSAVRIEVASTGALVESRTVAVSSEVFNLAIYSFGNERNNLRIKVRKGSAAPYYIPWETLTTIAAGAQSIYVSQIPDE